MAPENAAARADMENLGGMAVLVGAEATDNEAVYALGNATTKMAGNIYFA